MHIARGRRRFCIAGSVLTTTYLVHTSFCGSRFTLDVYLESPPPLLDLLLLVLLDLSVKLQQVHDAGLVKMDLMSDNVLVIHTQEGGLEIHVIDFGLATLPGQDSRFKDVDLGRYNQLSQGAPRRHRHHRCRRMRAGAPHPGGAAPLPG